MGKGEIILYAPNVLKERHQAKPNERPRPLRDTVTAPSIRPQELTKPVDQPTTLRQRVEGLINIPEAEVTLS